MGGGAVPGWDTGNKTALLVRGSHLVADGDAQSHRSVWWVLLRKRVQELAPLLSS